MLSLSTDPVGALSLLGLMRFYCKGKKLGLPVFWVRVVADDGRGLTRIPRNPTEAMICWRTALSYTVCFRCPHMPSFLVIFLQNTCRTAAQVLALD